MHELSLCGAIADIVSRRAADRPVTAVHVRVGALRQVVPSTLEFCWSMVVAGTSLDGAVLDLEQVPVVVHCPACDADRPLGEQIALACPACGTLGVTVVAGTRRESPLVWRKRFAAVGYSKGQTYESAWYEVEIVDRLGAGDALAAGLIHGLIDNDLKKGLDYGAAMGALKHSIPGDLPWLTKDEIESAMQGHGLRIRR